MNPHLAPRTIREWLELIPFDRARKEAIDNFEKQGHKNTITKSLSDAFDYPFRINLTPQGSTYWIEFRNSIWHMEQSVKLKQKS